MTTLQAVTQRRTFREAAMQALEKHQGADLVAFLAMLHDQEMAEAAEQSVSAHAQAVNAAAAAAVDQSMLTSVLSVVQPVLRTSAEASVRSQHFQSIVETVRALANDAEGNSRTIEPAELRSVLDVAQAPAPFRSRTIGFTPSGHYRVGQFRHIRDGQEYLLPFSGYVMCEEAPDRPMTVHVAFLHDSMVRARPQLYAEHGLVLEHME